MEIKYNGYYILGNPSNEMDKYYYDVFYLPDKQGFKNYTCEKKDQYKEKHGNWFIKDDRSPITESDITFLEENGCRIVIVEGENISGYFPIHPIKIIDNAIFCMLEKLPKKSD